VPPTPIKFTLTLDQIAVLIFLIGCWLSLARVSFHEFRSTWQSLHALRWPSVTGEITHLKLYEYSDSEIGMLHQVFVGYSYSIAGKTYRKSRLAFGYEATTDFRYHQQIMNALMHTSVICVRHHPQNHRITTLSAGIHRITKLRSLKGAIMFTVLCSFSSMFFRWYNIASFIAVYLLVPLLLIRIYVWFDRKPDSLLKNLQSGVAPVQWTGR
jgi:hypothetical protein